MVPSEAVAGLRVRAAFKGVANKHSRQLVESLDHVLDFQAQPLRRAAQ